MQKTTMRKLKVTKDGYWKPNVSDVVYYLMPGSVSIDTLDYLQNHIPYKSRAMEIFGLSCVSCVGFLAEGFRVALYTSALTPLAAEMLK